MDASASTPSAADPWAAVGVPFQPQQQQASQPAGDDPWAAVGIPADAQSGGEQPVALEPGEHVLTVGGRDPASAQSNTGNGGTALTAAESGVRGARQGVTFNWGDELSGLAAASPLPGKNLDVPDMNAIDVLAGGARLAAEKIAPSWFGTGGQQAYDAKVAQERAANDAAQQANPGSYMLGELGGAAAMTPIAPMLAPFKVAQGANLATRIAAPAANLALTGAAYGGLAGAGGGEGAPSDRIAPATRGAAAGAVLGPVVGGSAAALGSGARFVGGHLAASRNPQALADQVVSRAVENDAANLPQAAQQIQGANQPWMPPGVTRADLEQLATKFGTTYDDIASRLAARSNAVAQPLTLADVAGPSTQKLAGTIVRTPGPGSSKAGQFLNDRQLGPDPFAAGNADSQGGRIADTVGNILGDQGSIKVADDIIAKRSADASPLYAKAHGSQIDYGTNAGQNLKNILERIPASAKARANAILQVEDKGGHQLIWDKNPDGEFVLNKVPNTRQFDYIKRGLDDFIASERDPITRTLSTYGNALNGLKRDMLESLDKAVPIFGNARKVFAGHSEMLDALRSGKDIWDPSTTPEALAKQMDGMSAGEKEMFRLGAANALRDRMANAGDGANKVRLVFGSPALREKVRMIAPDAKSMSTLKTFLENENQMFATRAKATGGSLTAENLANDSDVAQKLGEGLHMAAQLKAGHIVGFTKAVFSQLGKINPERRGEVMEAARQIVLNPDPQAVQDFMQRVNASGLTSKARRAFYGAVVNSLPRATVTNATGMPDRARLPAPAH